MRAGKRAALYLRLSREDGDRDISQSIETQREQLLRYAAEQGFPVAGIYADDGYTGTNFNRPAFQRLIGDVEAGKIDIVLVKDLSRLGTRPTLGSASTLSAIFRCMVCVSLRWGIASIRCMVWINWPHSCLF